VCDHACVLARGLLTGPRLLGLAGSATLTAGAYQVGALPGRAAADALPGLADAPGALACLAGLLALTAAWWRIGQVTTATGGPVVTGRWMLGTAALWALPLLFAPPLASRDVYAYACQGAVVAAGEDPHRTGAAALPCVWLDSVPPIWRDAASPYGPLFSLLSGGAAAVSGGRIVVVVGLFRLLALVGVLLATWYGRRLAHECGVSPDRAAWLGLASPLVAVHAIAGAHNDALVTGLVFAAFAAALGRPRDTAALGRPCDTAALGRPRDNAAAGIAWRGAAAGLALGLAVAVKATALVGLPFVALALAATGGTDPAGAAAAHRGRLARAGAIVAGSTAVTSAALALASGLGLGFLRGLTRTGELAQWTSVPTAVGMTMGYALRAAGVQSGDDAAIATARGIGLVVLVAVVGAAWWRAWREPSECLRRAVVGAGIGFAAVALLGPVFYPWYALTPMALLAVSVRPERVRAWLAAAAAVLAFLVLPNGAGLAPRTKLAGALLVSGTLAATVVTAVARRRRRGLPAGSIPTASSTPGRSRRRDPPQGR